MSKDKRNSAIFVNGGAGRLIASIPALELFEKENPDDDFVSAAASDEQLSPRAPGSEGGKSGSDVVYEIGFEVASHLPPEEASRVLGVIQKQEQKVASLSTEKCPSRPR